MWAGDLTRRLPFFINEQTVEGPHAEAIKWSQKYKKMMCSKHMNDQVMLYCIYNGKLWILDDTQVGHVETLQKHIYNIDAIM